MNGCRGRGKLLPLSPSPFRSSGIRYSGPRYYVLDGPRARSYYKKGEPMKMKCDKCVKQATVHLTEIVDGQKIIVSAEKDPATELSKF